MGVPAFFRWLSEKYPKIVQDVLEERVKLVGGNGSSKVPFDCTRPNPSGLECDNLYIDMNGIIHPCSHPENGPQPTTEVEMYQNVCDYVDRLFRVIRPRKLLYLAIDGVAPRAKMNQQRARRFRSAQEARELLEVEQHVREELAKMGQKVPPAKKSWDSNVITPGTTFMTKLADYTRFYIRKRINTDPAWKNIRVIFSDASVPGEGEHKIMCHIRYQRSQPGYSPNLVHVLHGLDADLIMLALATHEAHFYISREEVAFGRRSQEAAEQRQLESGFYDKQQQFNEEAGDVAMQLLENKQKPLCRISIPILREYLQNEFKNCLIPGRLPFHPSFERLIDDIVFLCFFVGNDFLPHLPSLDIRDGALDYLFNVYKRILPTLGDYITNHGGQVNLSHVDVILAEVGNIEDYVFSMKHENELKAKKERDEHKQRKKAANGRSLDAPPAETTKRPRDKPMGKAARILERSANNAKSLKKEGDVRIKVSHAQILENKKAALALKESLSSKVKQENNEKESLSTKVKQDDNDKAMEDANDDDDDEDMFGDGDDKEDVNDNDKPVKVEVENLEVKKEDEKDKKKKAKTKDDHDDTNDKKRKREDMEENVDKKNSDGVGIVGDAEDEFQADDDEDDDDDDDDKPKVKIEVEADPDVSKAFKEKVKQAQQKQLDLYAKNVEDTVQLHKPGWKDRYYKDKCKAADVAAHGGREHLFRSYVMGLCWVMKYYYDGCPSWKWYFPFHYAPFASDLRNIDRFKDDVKKFEQSTPFNPVEQLMAVLPSDSSHAIPKAARWLMLDPESPIIDFYPTDVPVDPNGKAMPWLWVVLLPFIDEDRLLSAMTPTMLKWTKQELLCNARGLDDGYLFIHKSHPLSNKIKPVLQPGKTAKSPKLRLTDSASYGCEGFTGSVRPPLSHELYAYDDNGTIPAPQGSNPDMPGEGLFTIDIDENEVLCVAFTEPLKLSHKSILLPGAIVPPMTLTGDDFRIRRPRLNRGGGTIANLGFSQHGQSHESGYGSMNVGSYERQLAARTGRAHQMYQPGTRAWGAMEPAPKRQYKPSNPFNNNVQQHSQQHHQHQQYNNNNYNVHARNHQGQQQHHHQQQQQHHSRYPQQKNQHQQQQHQQHQHQQNQHRNHHQHQNQHQGNRSHNAQHQSHNRPHYNRFQQQQSSHHVAHSHRPPAVQQPPQQQQSFNFRSFNQSQNRPGQQQQQQQHPQQQQSRTNRNVMNSLKAQLASTLKQNRQQGGRR